MAVSSPAGLLLLLAGASLAATGLCLAQTKETQGSAAPAPIPSSPAFDVDAFLGLATSSTILQVRASERALGEATRPEVQEFAQKVIQLQRDLLQRLRALAQQRNLSVSDLMVLEHRAVYEGLEPLDGEEFARRYAETQAQALGQAVLLYQAAAERATDPELKQFAAETSPLLTEQFAAARRLVEAVRQ